MVRYSASCRHENTVEIANGDTKSLLRFLYPLPTTHNLRFVICVQLHSKFEALNKKHAQEKNRLEERKRQLEMEMSAFQQRKANATATHTLGKKKK